MRVDLDLLIESCFVTNETDATSYSILFEQLATVCVLGLVLPSYYHII